MNKYALRPSGNRRSKCDPCRALDAKAGRYGISVEEVLDLYEEQGHRCAICGTHEDEIEHKTFTHHPLVIDHDHTTGVVRGLLCPGCNLVVGHAKDSVSRLISAAQYLQESGAG